MVTKVTTYPLLKDIVGRKVPSYDDLPKIWGLFDINVFSKNKILWRFQREALKNAIRGLYLYYKMNETSEESERKRYLWNEYMRWEDKIPGVMDINLSKNSDLRKLMEPYYDIPEDGVLSYQNFINRMSFWMATGSGKTLVVVKLIGILDELMKNREIPRKEILFLTWRDDLIEQFEQHVKEFNDFSQKKIELISLKDYEKAQFYGRRMFHEIIRVFYYKSSNLSDVKGDKVLDFKNYENNGNWYVILDEAHKGSKEDSKRQHIYSIMSRNGFLFNFSATFTDPRDIFTSIYEFNLSSFIENGYGKHLFVFDENVKIGNKMGDFSENKKRKIILKSLILLTFIKKHAQDVWNKMRKGVYHSPLLLALVNSVNTEDADLKILFKELADIASVKGLEQLERFNMLFSEAKEELKKDIDKWSEKIVFEKRVVKPKLLELNNITWLDILNHVFNSNTPGEIEVIKSKNNDKELAFKLQTSEKPFALLKIGNAKDFLKWLLETHGYFFQERYEEEGFFSTLNENEDINILLGSRAFYEGWDSNRPNVLMFINIGTGNEAKKFVLQSIGRGVRIEPVKGRRKRLSFICREKEADICKKLVEKDIVPLETLFIWGTKPGIVKKIVEEIEMVKSTSGEKVDIFKKNIQRREGEVVLVPRYLPKVIDISKIDPAFKFSVSKEDYNDVTKAIKGMSDALLYVQFLIGREQRALVKTKLLREAFSDTGKNRYLKIVGDDKLGWIETIKRFFKYVDNIHSMASKYADLSIEEDHIKHYKQIKVKVSKKDEFEKLKEKIERAVLSGNVKVATLEDVSIFIYSLTPHYYIPLLTTKEEKVDIISNIINTESEYEFIEDLSYNVEFLDENFDWWMFSKVVENVDDIYIPYMDNEKMRRYYPDFVFWLRKENDYFIVFVDPKGTEHTNAERKIDGYENLFLVNDKPKVFEYKTNDGHILNTRIILLYVADKISSGKYESYWVSSIKEMVEKIKKWL